MGERFMRKHLARVLAALGVAIPNLAIPNFAFATPQMGAATATADGANTVWVLVASALVLLMCMPGLTLFYGGLVRAKNFLSVMVQVGAIAAVASLLWVVCGYSMAFGAVTNGWLGAGNALMLPHTSAVHPATTLTDGTFALFQMTFAAITPALMVGAWVDRARFSWVVLFSAAWGLVVYAPAAHWVWGGGWLAQQGTLDFAGGIVVHTTAGVSALMAVILLGKRQGFPKTLMLPHSPALTMVGASLLWVGWFGFNGGSALAGNAQAANAIINTHLAACAAAIMWMVIERFTVGKPTSVGFATGAVAGLATVTPAAGFISPMAAIAFGVAAAVICLPMIQLVKSKWKIDDSLDVFAVHGVGGMSGSLMLALFMSPDLGGSGYAAGQTMSGQFGAQALGVGAVAVWSAIATLALGWGLGKVVPMRVSEDEEREGLDLTSHGERAWELD
jgi:ammonium transporter, Amt family